MERTWITPAEYPDFKGKSVLITGGASGIGRCLALSYAQAGAQVYFADRFVAAGEETLSILAEHQVGARFLVCDVTDGQQLTRMVKTLLNETSGRLDVLINNAAIANAHTANLFSTDDTAFDQVLAVNLQAPFHLTRQLIPALAATGGCVINIISTRAFMSEPNSEGYAASKGGLQALTHAMAISLGDRGIRVNSIAPGWIDTTEWQLGSPPAIDWPAEEHRQHPAGRIGRPADIAAACFFLSGRDAGFITGENITIDGGMTKRMIYR
ncbi:MAG: short-chain dehydrogenase/reductase [Firmicutes bacterium]|nr:short-chain dehydrogenase/reductase [Bacillota bacterium]